MKLLKHRTQISLDDWQYQLLLDLSRKTKKSLSALIREIITEKFATSQMEAGSDPLFGIVGLGSSGRKDTSRDHDGVLYEKKR
ncbi:MAG TPA: ribbon-helix-helix domain-containing protein [Geobacterales bacterium]|nr:ribbon-helix-helix domain-containing protein [Geobacterales bacterium]